MSNPDSKIKDAVDRLHSLVAAKRAQTEKKLDDANAARAAVEREAIHLAEIEAGYAKLVRDVFEIRLNRGLYTEVVANAEQSLTDKLSGIAEHLVTERGLDDGAGNRIKYDNPAADRIKIINAYDEIVRCERIVADSERVLAVLDSAIAAKEKEITDYAKLHGLA